MNILKSTQARKFVFGFSSIILITFGFIQFAYAKEPLKSVVVTVADANGDVLNVKLKTESGKSWNVQVEKDKYLRDSIPLIGVSVDTGHETLLDTIDNCYFRSTMTGNANTVAFIKRCSADTIDLRGFIADSEYVYVIEPDADSPTGLALEISDPGARTVYKPDNETDNGWKEGGSGGNQVSTQLVTRIGGAPFPSLEVFVDPDFVASSGEDNYVDRVIEQLAFANFAYAQSGIKQITLVAIVRTDAEVGRNESPLNLLSGLERLRERTMQINSADVAALFTGKDRSGNGYWGYSEIGGACDLRTAVSLGDLINKRNVAKGMFVSFDLPSLMQRAWTVMHEMGHTLDANHVIGDYIMDANIELVAPLSAYTLTCPAKVQFLQSCEYDPINKKLTDYYECSE